MRNQYTGGDQATFVFNTTYCTANYNKDNEIYKTKRCRVPRNTADKVKVMMKATFKKPL